MHRYSALWNVCAKKTAMLQNRVKQTVMQTQPFETVAEKYSSSDINVILFTEGKIFTVATLMKTHWMANCAHASTKKKDVATEPLHTSSAFTQWPMASVSESQVVESIRHTTIKSTTEIGMCQWRCLCHESRCCSGIGTLLQWLAAGCVTGIGLQHIGLRHVNYDQSAKHDKPRRV